VELAVGAFVDAANAAGWMPVAVGDEHPDQLAVGVARELNDEREGSLRRRPIGRGQVELGAAGQPRPIGAVRCAWSEVRERDAVVFEPGSRARGDLERSSREAADRFAPHGVVEAHRQPPAA
jgi:hypothetical protein